MAQSFKAVAASSLREYLLTIQESGLDGLPVAAPPATMAQAATGQQTAVVETGEPPHDRKHESLEKIRKSLGDCQRCKLAKGRRNLVFGVGNPQARLVFVGEGPGGDEDRQGEPFVGEAGQVLNRIITAMGLEREDVYICNVVKCRPPDNRDPETDEIAACAPFLLRQLQAVQPEVIVALGRFATQTLLGTKEAISKLRGKFRDYHGVPVMPTYHPSYLLRHRGDSGPFWEVWEDMTQVLRLLKLPVPEKSRKR
ncbi:uracil-DNA glycosylase [Oryzomonas sagensis]|uniref:Type-4 uracil-DNA glycosylase n=1 Tax=Oryzomonas sagensis TaxID=2603857 RepID=A0ABQ6TSL5_9BACT|nr:uracil-DNA glycosylase [Oryzomonas sagensis]KAB0671769.1 uracil-DNA glycosylase [Oryzomonas sagensis]